MIIDQRKTRYYKPHACYSVAWHPVSLHLNIVSIKSPGEKSVCSFESFASGWICSYIKPSAMRAVGKRSVQKEFVDAKAKRYC